MGWDEDEDGDGNGNGMGMGWDEDGMGMRMGWDGMGWDEDGMRWDESVESVEVEVWKCSKCDTSREKRREEKRCDR
jgi:hypothetical protein